MVKNRKFKKLKKRFNQGPLLIGNNIFKLLEAMGGNNERAKLSALWENWEEILGPELGSMAKPAGYRGSTLLVAAEDALEMQELSMQSEEILQCVNTFLNKEYFLKLKITLIKK